MIATVLSLWKAPTPNYIINLLFCVSTMNVYAHNVSMYVRVCILLEFYDHVMHCTFADLGSNKVSSSSSWIFFCRLKIVPLDWESGTMVHLTAVTLMYCTWTEMALLN